MARDKKGRFIDGEVGKEYRFTSESMKGNTYSKGNKPNKTTWRKGDTAMEKHPQWKGGLQKWRDGYYVQVATGKRISRGRHVWEQVYGEIPKGYIIRHKDGNKFNDKIGNLECISRAENILRNAR